MERYARRTLPHYRFRPRAGLTARVTLRLPRFLGFVLAASLFLALAPAHAGQKYTQSLNFQTFGQSMWKTGHQYEAQWSKEYGDHWDGSAGAGGFITLSIPAECIPAVVISGVTI